MYGYQPPRSQQSPGCRDTLVLMRVAFALLMPFLLGGLGVISWITLTIVLFGQHWALGMIPVAITAAGIVWLWRRDLRARAERDREARSGGGEGGLS